jgi:hypothetical protein
MQAFQTRLIMLLIVGVGLAACRSAAPELSPAPVLMVCEHGSVKSLMAASLFNKAAIQRGLPYRAISRGISPDVSVPPKIAAALGQEGFDVTNFVPAKATAAEVAQAPRVVVIGVDAGTLGSSPSAQVDAWLDVPAASVDYPAASASLKHHVDTLLDELEKGRALRERSQ